MSTGGKIILGLAVGGSFGALAYWLFKKARKYQTVKTNEKAFDFTDALNMVKQEEGFRATPYWDNTQWTWGYGTAAGYNKSQKPSGTITQAQATLDALAFLQNLYTKIGMRLTVPVNHNQMTALLDFGFNLGPGNLNTVLDNINAGYTPQETAAEINLYVNSGGVPNDTLIARRGRESDLYLS